MKRSILYLIAAVMVLTLIPSACRKAYVDIPVTGVLLNKTTAVLEVNSTLTLEATVIPEEAYNTSVKWKSSNTAIATVVEGITDETCVVTALSPGEVIIIVTTEEGGFTATCNITVNMSVAGITLNKTTLTLVEGTSETLTATISPPNASNKTIQWTSSDNTVATVGSSDGKVTALKASPTAITITATTQDGSKSANCSVIVTAAEVPVNGITLNESTLTIDINKTAKLEATVWPANATNKNYIWLSKSPSIASVDAHGVVTALSPGNATITVTTLDGSKTDSCIVTVVVPVTSITLNKTKMTLDVGDKETLIPSILPANATNKTVNWRSSDPAIATVAQTGEVTAVTHGEVSIVASTQDGGNTAICVVTVNSLNTPVTQVTITKSTLSLIVGGSEKLAVSILPVGATNKNVTWSSSHPAFATVAADGTVTAIAAGTATITATAADGSGKTGTCVVTVTPIVAVTGVTLNRAAATIYVDSSITLVATVAPAGATNQNVTWESDDEDIAEVDEDGKVTGIAPGTATITVTTEDGDKTATCVITVEP